MFPTENLPSAHFCKNVHVYTCTSTNCMYMYINLLYFYVLKLTSVKNGCHINFEVLKMSIQLISLNRNPVNWNFRKRIGCEALAPYKTMVHYYDDCFDRYHNEPLSCMGVKASQPTHFLKFQLTGFRLSEINCITTFGGQAAALKLGNLRQNSGSLQYTCKQALSGT